MTAVQTGARKLNIQSKANIRNIIEPHEAIVSLFLETNSVELDLEQCNDVDLSFIQLIESARIFAKTTGKQISLSAPAQGAVLQTLNRAGFLDELSPEDARFWLHREVM